MCKIIFAFCFCLAMTVCASEKNWLCRVSCPYCIENKMLYDDLYCMHCGVKYDKRKNFFLAQVPVEGSGTCVPILKVSIAGVVGLPWDDACSVYGADISVFSAQCHSVVGISAGLGVDCYSSYGMSVGYGCNIYEVYGITVGCLTTNHKMHGMSLALFNMSSDAYGIQLGFHNSAYKIRGLQIGLINEVEYLQGIQIGVLNYAQGELIWPINVKF